MPVVVATAQARAVASKHESAVSASRTSCTASPTLPTRTGPKEDDPDDPFDAIASLPGDVELQDSEQRAVARVARNEAKEHGVSEASEIEPPAPAKKADDMEQNPAMIGAGVLAVAAAAYFFTQSPATASFM